MASKKHAPGLSLDGIPKPELDNILHHLLLNQVRYAAQDPNVIYRPLQRHRYVLYQYYKNFRFINRLKGSALSLLQTQYAKKPKNPV